MNTYIAAVSLLSLVACGGGELGGPLDDGEAVVVVDDAGPREAEVDAGARDSGFCRPVTQLVCHSTPECPACGGDGGCQWVTHPCL